MLLGEEEEEEEELLVVLTQESAQTAISDTFIRHWQLTELMRKHCPSPCGHYSKVTRQNLSKSGTVLKRHGT